MMSFLGVAFSVMVQFNLGAIREGFPLSGSFFGINFFMDRILALSLGNELCRDILVLLIAI